MMTPKDLLDTMLGYLGFVVDIEETTNEGGNPTLQIYTEESRRLVHNAFKDDPEVATWSPSDSARIKQITLLKRAKKPAPQGTAAS